jgi:hypothetical protein
MTARFLRLFLSAIFIADAGLASASTSFAAESLKINDRG